MEIVILAILASIVPIVLWAQFGTRVFFIGMFVIILPIILGLWLENELWYLTFFPLLWAAVKLENG
jgi:hypothetical protein